MFAYWNILLRKVLAKYAILVHLYVVFMKFFFIHQKKTYLTLVLHKIKIKYNFIFSRESLAPGTLKGGGDSTTPPPLNIFFGKVKKRYKKNEKWMGREVMVPVNIFSGFFFFENRSGSD